MLIQGTTPTHSFTLPSDMDISDFIVSYSQCGKEILKKTKKDCVVKENTIFVTLTQEDTLKFAPDMLWCVQVKIKLQNNTILVSDNVISEDTVQWSSNKEVMS